MGVDVPQWQSACLAQKTRRVNLKWEGWIISVWSVFGTLSNTDFVTYLLRLQVNKLAYRFSGEEVEMGFLCALFLGFSCPSWTAVLLPELCPVTAIKIWQTWSPRREEGVSSLSECLGENGTWSVFSPVFSGTEASRSSAGTPRCAERVSFHWTHSFLLSWSRPSRFDPHGLETGWEDISWQFRSWDSATSKNCGLHQQQPLDFFWVALIFISNT